MAQYQSVHHKPQMYCPRTEPGSPWWEARTNHLRYGIAYKNNKIHITVILYIRHDELKSVTLQHQSARQYYQILEIHTII